MKVLLLGSGGREHAFAWKMAQSSTLEELFIAPGNAGTRAHGTNVAIDTTDFEAIKAFVLEKKINNNFFFSLSILLKTECKNFLAHNRNLKKQLLQ